MHKKANLGANKVLDNDQIMLYWISDEAPEYTRFVSASILKLRQLTTYTKQFF